MLGGLVSLLGGQKLEAAETSAIDAAAIGQPGASGRASADGLTEMLLQVDINQQGFKDTALVLKAADGALLVAREDLEHWRIRLPAQGETRVRGQAHYRLQAIPGASVELDEERLTLALTLPAAAFRDFRLETATTPGRAPATPSPGMFFNYDVVAERDDSNHHLSGLFELGTFNAHGVGVASFVDARGGDKRRAARLETTWTFDRHEQLASWRIGDSISRAASTWGRAVRFGGLQVSSNFALQPGFVNLPQQSFSAQAALPSTVEVFVNNALVNRNEVPPGPFSVSNIPVISGHGDVRVVVRDLLGREQVISQPFYSSAQLLRAGLGDFSYEAGRQRNNFGVLGNDYGQAFAALTYRQGVSATFTGEVHAEALSGNAQTAGLNGTWAVAGAAILNAAIAASHGERGTAWLGGAGFETTIGNLFLSGRMQAATSAFTQLGQQAGQLAPRRLANLNGNYSLAGMGSIGASVVLQDNRDAARAEVVSVTYTRPLGKSAFAGITALKTLGSPGNHSIGAFLIIPLDKRSTASVSAQRHGNQSRLSAQYQRSLPSDEGSGYRLQASRDGAQQAEVNYQNAVGTYSLGIESLSGQTSARAGASGGLAMLGGAAYASRRINDSFAVVQVPGYAGVRVYGDNQLVGRTDARGNILIPRVRAFEENPISIESQDLPLDARIDVLKMAAMPAYRSGVLLTFPVMPARAATLKIVLADGRAVPAGAQVSVDERDEVFPVANDGEVYLSDLSNHSALQVSWRGQRCRIPVAYPAGGDPLPFLGTHVCEGVSR